MYSIGISFDYMRVLSLAIHQFYNILMTLQFQLDVGTYNDLLINIYNFLDQFFLL